MMKDHHSISLLPSIMHKSLVKAINDVTTLSKPQKKFLIIIINVFIVVVGNANYRNLSRYCSISEKNNCKMV